MFKFCFSDRKEQFFLLNKEHFADVASSYTVRRAIEKMQRSVAKKNAFAGRKIIFKHALNPMSDILRNIAENYYIK